MLLPVACALLAALVWLWLRYRRLVRSSCRSSQQAPGVGPLTTLLITDVQNSTGLYEELPEEVCGGWWLVVSWPAVMRKWLSGVPW